MDNFCEIPYENLSLCLAEALIFRAMTPCDLTRDYERVTLVTECLHRKLSSRNVASNPGNFTFAGTSWRGESKLVPQFCGAWNCGHN
jgi:hypothetical protein